MDDLDALLNRCDKNQKRLKKWLKDQELVAYRLYDRDMPEFPLAIDRYADGLHVQVFERKRPVTDEQLDKLRDALLQHFQLEPIQLGFKTRKRQRGLDQYEKLALDAPSFEVSEYGLSFEVHVHLYLDTGLFLDHRQTRKMVREQSQGKSLLNLFAYTGSFTTYAAAGGASRSLTVDMSKTYQAWSQRNLEINGLASAQHQMLHTDVLAFLADRQQKLTFDLIVLDPPSFSNSKRMHNTFDVQRDQVDLLRNTLRFLAPGGQLIFSNNRQGFSLDEQLLNDANFEEITQQTVPMDFARYRPHRCWKVTR